MNKGVFSKRNRVLLYELVKTDFKLRYQGSFLGVLWSVLRPLMLFAVMYLVFVKFLRFTDGTAEYPMILLLGISLWGFFTEATNVGMHSVVGRGDIIRKINFPKQIIVMSAMMSAMISLAINLFVVLIFSLITGVKFSWWILLLPLNIFQLIVLAFGVSMFLSAFYVKFRDIGHIYEVLLQIVFYSTPIIYPISQVSKFNIFGISAQKIIMMNPIAQIIQDIRHNLISVNVPTTWSVVDNFFIKIIPVLITAFIFVVGFFYFNAGSKKFAEEI